MKCLKNNQIHLAKASHPARGAWIEIYRVIFYTAASKSHPARGAWIEIFVMVVLSISAIVAPRKGCVD